MSGDVTGGQAGRVDRGRTAVAPVRDRHAAGAREHGAGRFGAELRRHGVYLAVDQAGVRRDRRNRQVDRRRADRRPSGDAGPGRVGQEVGIARVRDGEAGRPQGGGGQLAGMRGRVGAAGIRPARDGDRSGGRARPGRNRADGVVDRDRLADHRRAGRAERVDHRGRRGLGDRHRPDHILDGHAVETVPAVRAGDVVRSSGQRRNRRAGCLRTAQGKGPK